MWSSREFNVFGSRQHGGKTCIVHLRRVRLPILAHSSSILFTTEVNKFGLELSSQIYFGRSRWKCWRKNGAQVNPFYFHFYLKIRKWILKKQNKFIQKFFLKKTRISRELPWNLLGWGLVRNNFISKFWNIPTCWI